MSIERLKKHNQFLKKFICDICSQTIVDRFCWPCCDCGIEIPESKNIHFKMRDELKTRGRTKS